MDRRGFLSGSLALFVVPLAADGQPAGQITGGQTFMVKRRGASGDYKRISGLAA